MDTSRRPSEVAMHLPTTPAATHQQHTDNEPGSPVLTPTPSFDEASRSQNAHVTTTTPPFSPLQPTPSITSPFYEHPPASHELSRPSTKQKQIHSIYEKDLESGELTPIPTSQPELHPFTSQVSIGRNQECKMWPSRQTLMQTRKDQKKQRRANRTCAPLRDRWCAMSKRQRLVFKIATALFIVGIAVAIGVGISIAVNGGYYASAGSSKQIHTS